VGFQRAAFEVAEDLRVSVRFANDDAGNAPGFVGEGAAVIRQ
jgi:hypothetical protein